jgi:hypothetical protein
MINSKVKYFFLFFVFLAATNLARSLAQATKKSHTTYHHSPKHIHKLAQNNSFITIKPSKKNAPEKILVLLIYSLSNISCIISYWVALTHFRIFDNELTSLIYKTVDTDKSWRVALAAEKDLRDFIVEIDQLDRIAKYAKFQHERAAAEAQGRVEASFDPIKRTYRYGEVDPKSRKMKIRETTSKQRLLGMYQHDIFFERMSNLLRREEVPFKTCKMQGKIGQTIFSFRCDEIQYLDLHSLIKRKQLVPLNPRRKRENAIWLKKKEAKKIT